MKVLLLKDVRALGHKGDLKEVTAGYAANFLFPQKLAEFATEAKIAQHETQHVQVAKHRAEISNSLNAALVALDGTTVTIPAKANEKGHLFSGLHEKEIVEAIKKETSYRLTPEHVVLSTPLKELGEFSVGLTGAGKEYTLTVSVIRES